MLYVTLQFDKTYIHYEKTNTYTLKVKGHGYTLAPSPRCQVQPSISINGEGNTHEKALFMCQTLVESSVSNDETFYALPVLEKERKIPPCIL